MSSRSYNTSSATLSYDALDHFVQWNNSGATTQEWYAYDAGGSHVLRRSTSGGTTTMTVYAFGLEEHTYDGSGNNQSNTYYYSLGGQLIGELTGSPATTNFLLTDGLGSVMATFSNTASSAAVLGNQVYSPYGNQRYTKGSMGTAKGFTGQYNDATGLDYYNARYYDPVAGVFLSADSVQGNGEGLNPYGYVGGNPETDPLLPVVVPIAAVTAPAWLAPVIAVAVIVGAAVVIGVTLGAIVTIATTTTLASGDLPPGSSASFAQAFQFTAHSSGGSPQPGGGGGQKPPGGGYPAPAPSDPCSFTPDTHVATSRGEQAIGTLRVGDKVWAYNPKTHKMELQPILHVWMHSDSDLVDLTITTTTTSHGHIVHKSEVVHTTSEHPFFTVERGFVPAGKVKVGMHVLRADGTLGVVTGWQVVHSTKVMYNLEVAHDHTFTVGVGQWVVHNACNRPELRRNLRRTGTLQEGQQAHHILPCALESDPLVQRAGLNINSAVNGIGLPSTEEMSLQDNLPQHSGSHPAYTGRVLSRLIDERGTLGETYGSVNVKGIVSHPLMKN